MGKKFFRHFFRAAKCQLANFFDIAVNGVQVTYAPQNGYGGFFANAGDTGNIVGFVPHQRQVIDNQLRWHAKFGFHARAIEKRIGHRVDQRDVAVDQLCHVLVAGRDNSVERLRCGLLGQRADDIVGLDALDNQ